MSAAVAPAFDAQGELDDAARVKAATSGFLRGLGL